MSDIIMPAKLYSGGQTGADRAGLDYGIAQSIEIGGFCPKGRRAEDGPIPAKYPLRETATPHYDERTIKNVAFSSATVIFNRERRLSPGTALTLNAAKTHHKPVLLCTGLTFGEQALHEQSHLLLDWLVEQQPKILNVAGNRESTQPGIYAFVFACLQRTYQLAATMTRDEVFDRRPAPQPTLDLFGQPARR